MHLEKRLMHVNKNGDVISNIAIIGSVWLSGFDERLLSSLPKLKEGVYEVTFKASDADGSDAITDIKIVPRQAKQ